MTCRAIWIVVGGLASALAPASVGAQTFQEAQEFSVERFELPSDVGGLLGVEWAEVPKHLRWGLGLWAGGADEPLVLNEVDAAGQRLRTGALVRTRVGGSLTASLALFDWIGLSLDMPVVLHQTRNESVPGIQGSLQPLNRWGLGAPRVMPKLRLLRQRDHGIGLAVLPTFNFPQTQDGNYLGDQGWGFAPTLVISRSFRYLRMSMDGGVRLREDQTVFNLKVTDELFARGGLGLTFASLGVPLELDATVSVATAIDKPFTQDYQDHIEVLGGLRSDITDSVMVFAGGGMGIERGFGTPDWRVFGGLRFTGLLDRDEVPMMRTDGVQQIVVQVPAPPPAPPAPPCALCTPAESIARSFEVPMGPPLLKAEPLREVVYFRTNRSRVRPEFARVLSGLARKVRGNPDVGVLAIIGHTDAKGTERSNRGLSRRRARAVMRFLLALGVPRDRLSLGHHGEKVPQARNDMPEGRLLNRRVEVIAIPEITEASAAYHRRVPVVRGPVR